MIDYETLWNVIGLLSIPVSWGLLAAIVYSSQWVSARRKRIKLEKEKPLAKVQRLVKENVKEVKRFAKVKRPLTTKQAKTILILKEDDNVQVEVKQRVEAPQFIRVGDEPSYEGTTDAGPSQAPRKGRA